jgi:hypothetical protein
LTSGDRNGDQAREANVRRACGLGNKVWDLGGCPFVPHLTETWHRLFPKDYEWWMEYDFNWLKACDIMFRMNGASPGADREEEFARARNIPIVFSLKQLQEEIAKWQTARTSL